MTDTDLRYSFACPSCSGSFSIGLERIPPVKARFSCPRCGTSMEFPSRDEARIYMMLQTRDLGNAPFPPPPEREYEPEPPRPLRAAAPQPVEPPKPVAPAPPPPAPQAAPPPPRPVRAAAPPPPPPPAERTEQKYVVQRVGFEGDVFDRRAIRTLIRTGALHASDPIVVDGGAPMRADDLQDLKSLFALRKTARFSPPAVCPKHIDQLAHFVCTASRRPLCSECAEERRFGGTAVRVCSHCAGNVEELPVTSE